MHSSCWEPVTVSGTYVILLTRSDFGELQKTLSGGSDILNGEIDDSLGGGLQYLHVLSDRLPSFGVGGPEQDERWPGQGGRNMCHPGVITHNQ